MNLKTSEEMRNRYRTFNNSPRIDALCDDIDTLQAENKCYREALEFYADVGNYQELIVESLPVNDIPIGQREYDAPEVIEDNGEKAREALEK